MKENDRSFEITKMSVTKTSQGRGISKLLIDTCIKMAKEKNGIAFSFTLTQSLLRLFNFIAGIDSMKLL